MDVHYYKSYIRTGFYMVKCLKKKRERNHRGATFQWALSFIIGSNVNWVPLKWNTVIHSTFWKGLHFLLLNNFARRYVFPKKQSLRYNIIHIMNWKKPKYPKIGETNYSITNKIGHCAIIKNQVMGKHLMTLKIVYEMLMTNNLGVVPSQLHYKHNCCFSLKWSAFSEISRMQLCYCCDQQTKTFC